jgi:hypothetical protein
MLAAHIFFGILSVPDMCFRPCEGLLLYCVCVANSLVYSVFIGDPCSDPMIPNKLLEARFVNSEHFSVLPSAKEYVYNRRVVGHW